ncbi:aldo/keto reductase [Actinoplanes sichuanensis]|uniref:Aldo/keto reductase n=1 Tax=Actinoplanes sichuanensis TaxID=512349 RepID=A0ABW4AT41_9ACTN|nr:aldo/keto reductase [Actinoplanes sichuanensis]BEL07197.1 aldo/keto reductase [Actinoplanes sichuanensis]
MIPRRRVGASGLQVSALTLGAMTFDRSGPFGAIGSDPSELSRIVSAAVEAGIDTFDTANVYGESEELLGRILGPFREDVVICTKVRFPFAVGKSESLPPSNTYGLSRRAVIRSVEESLRRLGTEYLDVLWLHMQDRSVPIEETLVTLDKIVQQGKIRYFGISNFMGYRLTEAVLRAQMRDLEGPVGVQLSWSLVERGAEQEVVPAARHLDLGIFAYSPLARGFLSGKYQRGAVPAHGSRLAEWRDEYERYDVDRNWAVLAELVQVASEHNVPVGAVAIAWLLAKNRVASVIVGARTEAQLRENIVAARLVLTRSEIDRLDKVSKPDWGYPCDFIQRFEPW